MKEADDRLARADASERRRNFSKSSAKPFIRIIQPLSFNSMPNDFATVKMSLSPRPHMFMQIM